MAAVLLGLVSVPPASPRLVAVLVYLIVELDRQSRDGLAVVVVMLAAPLQPSIVVSVLQPILVPAFVSSTPTIGVASSVIRSECLFPTVEGEIKIHL